MGSGRAARTWAGALARFAGLLVGVSVLLVLAVSALPGDAADARGRLTPEQRDALRQELGLDRPLLVRWAEWVTGLLTGDLGDSLTTGRPVADLVGERLPTSLTLVIAALVLSVALAVPLAIAAAGSSPPRRAVAGLVAGAAALPQVVVAVGLAALLSATWGLVPAVSLLPAGVPAYRRPDLVVLPVLTLALPSAAYAAGLLRGMLADAAAQPFVTDAVRRGVGRTAVALRHVGPLIAAPSARLLAVVAGSLVAGTAVAETLFGLAGLGELFTAAVAARDAPVVLAVGMLAATVGAAGLLVADLTAAVTR